MGISVKMFIEATSILEATLTCDSIELFILIK